MKIKYSSFSLSIITWMVIQGSEERLFQKSKHCLSMFCDFLLHFSCCYIFQDVTPVLRIWNQEGLARQFTKTWDIGQIRKTSVNGCLTIWKWRYRDIYFAKLWKLNVKYCENNCKKMSMLLSFYHSIFNVISFILLLFNYLFASGWPTTLH